ncbi:hypothetical protein [Saccharothrix deserti]|uniref:hypothetical protein n=1 Tax=Saccharothrix deserti TaxID=2593674 RepID=UPI00131D3760|nr:hypothetical protein [Saccharothrix deserti]
MDAVAVYQERTSYPETCDLAHHGVRKAFRQGRQVRHHGAFTYVAGELADGTTLPLLLPLLRLRSNGSARGSPDAT